MSQITHAEVLQRLSSSEEDLLASIGGDLTGRQALPLQPAELADRGCRWFEAQTSYLQSQICTSEKVEAFVRGENDEATIVVEIANLLVGLLLPVNPLTLAVLIVKKGMQAFCESVWLES